MKVTGEIILRAPRDVVFNALRDARFFASCVDGVRDLTEIDGTHYVAVFETKVAYMTFKFNVSVELVRVEAPDTIQARFEGAPLGIIGRLTAISMTKLTEVGTDTKIDY